MKRSAIALTFLFTSLTLAAQTDAGTAQPIAGMRGNAAGNDCPIGIRATQGVWDRTIKVRQGQREQSVQPFGQRLFLSLVDQNSAAIVSATVKVRGLTGKSHALQTEAVGNTSADGAKIMRITFVQRPEGVFSDLYAPGFTSASSVELQEVSYADGKTWKMAGTGVCSVTPDPVMLISNR